MEKPDMRIDALHNLAIELQHQAQYAVGRRVLRSEIDGEIARRSFGHIGLTYRLLMQLPAFPGVPSKYKRLSTSPFAMGIEARRCTKFQSCRSREAARARLAAVGNGTSPACSTRRSR